MGGERTWVVGPLRGKEDFGLEAEDFANVG